MNVVANFHWTDFKNNASVMSISPHFDLVEKIVLLHEEKNALLERLLRAKDELIEEVKRLIARQQTDDSS